VIVALSLICRNGPENGSKPVEVTDALSSQASCMIQRKKKRLPGREPPVLDTLLKCLLFLALTLTLSLILAGSGLKEFRHQFFSHGALFTGFRMYLVIAASQEACK